MYELYCRAYQAVLRATSYLLPWRRPALLEGENSIKKLPALMKENGVDSVLVVTDKGIAASGLLEKLLERLMSEQIKVTLFDKTVPNPTIGNIEEALEMYKANSCSGIVALGGGSPIDCAKGVGARVARPRKSIPQMKGLLKIRKKTPCLFAIPTTAGTGSEATISAVISNPDTQEKYPLNDLSLIPHFAVLDPSLTVGLPGHLTATTGMDALTHAVEALIGRSNTKETKEYGTAAVKIIFANILEAYNNGSNLKARANMQKASYMSGIAFTRAYVGNVHAIAHTLGGFYGVPHGLANAVILPYVLEFYEKAVHRSLAELADLVGVSQSADSDESKAKAFIEAIKKLNNEMNIPKKISGIQEKDIALMTERAFQESNPFYPVPVIMSKNDFKMIYQLIKE